MNLKLQHQIILEAEILHFEICYMCKNSAEIKNFPNFFILLKA